MLNITFPVYPLRSYTKKVTIDKITLIETYYDTYVLDNKNLEGTFGERRLQIRGKLYPLSNKISTFEELIKYNKPGKEYIDYDGNIFKYQPTKKVTVNSYPVEDIKKLKSGGYLITTDRIKPIIYHGDYLEHFNYALIFENNGYIIYSFSDEYMEPMELKI